ncbi:MAG: HNH endonuclease [Bdellovibrionaceae bacterium]|nr:HNH endonuclease [Pseudobdellovibrionaceae bacterium]
MICVQKFCRVASSVFFSLFLILPQISQAFPLIPDRDMTPGHICEVSDPDFKEYRYYEQIPYCYRNVSSSRKKQIYAKYRIPKSCQHRYTIDHLIPLSIGGSNTDENLWPEHVLVKATRANLENQIYWSLRRGEITQEEAVETVLLEKNNVVQVLQSHNFKSGCDIPTL